MDIDQFPLNKAHQLQRKADKLNKQKKWDECIQCWADTIEEYEKCLKIGDNERVLESIQLQKEFAERQIRTLQLKKAYCERMDKQKKLNEMTYSGKPFQKEEVENLETKIFRNFETHDSLISFLAQRGIIKNTDRDYQSTIIEEVDELDISPGIVGNKLPKDDSIVIEELKELSGQLRESVQGVLIKLGAQKKQIDQITGHLKKMELEKSFKEDLLIQLDDRNKEIEQLKAHIHDLELKKSDKQVNLEICQKSPPSPDLYIPELGSLPELEPMELPEMDLSAFRNFKIPESFELPRRN